MSTGPDAPSGFPPARRSPAASPDAGDSRQVDVSIVLPTYRRPNRLAAALASLTAQEGPPFEVLVIDNDPEHSARSVVDRFISRARVPVRYLVEPRPGATFARNRGIEEASAPVIVTIDDDIIARPGWLAALVAPIEDDRADVTGGRVVLDPQVPRPRWFEEVVVGAYLTSFDLGDTGRELTGDEYVVTANAAFRREMLEDVGGFDVTLGPRGLTQLVSDDVAMVRALRRRGARACWVPEAVVEHELPRSRLRPSWLLHRAYLQGRSDWMVDHEELRRRRANGARVAIAWLRRQLALRRREGLLTPSVVFHAACDLARTAGALREAASWALGGVRPGS